MFFDIRKTTKGGTQKFWWVAKGGNGEIMCQSEMLSSKQNCKNSIRTVKDEARYANVYDETGDIVGDADAKKISV